MEKKEMRRRPVQERGQRRIEQILDAADELFAEVGYEGTTTNAIAARARTAIGSLYQFFPDKEAILQALAARYHEQLRLLHDRVLTEETARLPLSEVYDRVIQALADFYAAHPGFQPLFWGSATSAGLAAAGELLRQECIARVERMLAIRMPELEERRRNLLASINVDVIKALLPLSESGGEGFRASVLGEIKRLLLGYMREVTGEES
jgi:AcrR family transcriptional regulator